MKKKTEQKSGRTPWNKGLTKAEDSRIAQPWLGKKRDEDTINKISKSNKGSTHTEETKAKISKATTGKKLSEETKNKIAEAMHKLGRPEHLKGPSNPRWTGRNRKSLRSIVLKRDHFMCVICSDVAVEVDHIIPIRIRPDMLSDFSNMQSLCRKCHRKKTNNDIKGIKILLSL